MKHENSDATVSDDYISLHSPHQTEVVVVASPEGARRLARALITLADAGGGDVHWMSETWGGQELRTGSPLQTAVHHLKLVVG